MSAPAAAIVESRSTISGTGGVPVRSWAERTTRSPAPCACARRSGSTALRASSRSTASPPSSSSSAVTAAAYPASSRRTAPLSSALRTVSRSGTSPSRRRRAEGRPAGAVPAASAWSARHSARSTPAAATRPASATSPAASSATSGAATLVRPSPTGTPRRRTTVLIPTSPPLVPGAPYPQAGRPRRARPRAGTRADPGLSGGELGLRESEAVTEGTPRGVPAVHAVHAGCGWRRGGAEVDAGDAERVRVPPAGRAAEHPAEGDLPAGDVPADEVGVVLGHPGGRDAPTPDDDVPEAGGEALDLPGDGLGHVDVRAHGHVRVGPQRSQAVPLARRVGDGRVGQEHARPLRHPPPDDVVLRRGDLGAAAADVHGEGAADVGHRP